MTLAYYAHRRVMMSEAEITQGVCQDGAAILADGQPLTIEEIIADVRKAQYHDRLVDALSELVDAEWMVSHDWGGDRGAVLGKAEALLSELKALDDNTNQPKERTE